MKKSVLAIIIAALAVGVLAFILLVNKSDTNKEADSTTSQTSETTNPSQDSTEQPPSTPTESNTDQSGSDATQPAEVSVTIKDYAFNQQNITVKKGTKVTWTNQDSVQHNVHSDQDGGPKGDLLSKGKSYSFTFDTVGTFNYYCEPHPYMTGKVTVTE